MILNVSVGIGVDARWGSLMSIGHLPVDHVSITGVFTEQDLSRCVESFPLFLAKIHHVSYVQPSNPRRFDEQWLNWLDKVNQELSVLWTCEDIGYWTNLAGVALGTVLPPLIDEDSLCYTIASVKEVQAAFSVPHLIEYPEGNGVFGKLDLNDWILKLCVLTGSGLVLDLPHVLEYSVSQGTYEVMTGLRPLLPFVEEIHISGGEFRKCPIARYRGTHSLELDPMVLELFSALCRESMPNLKAVTIEFAQEVAIDGLKQTLNLVRSYLEG